MVLEGIIFKDKNYWLVEIPALDLMTQGRTKKKAYEMVVDAIESLVNKKGFKVSVYCPPSLGKIGFTVVANDAKQMAALLLKRQRAKSGKTIRQIVKILKLKSPRAYSQYEEGDSLPSIPKIEEFIGAMNSKTRLSLNLVE